MPPAEGFLDEIHASGEAVLQAATGLGDAVLSWHGRFYATGEPAEREAAALAVLGEAAQVLVGDRRSTARVVGRVEKRVRGTELAFGRSAVDQLKGNEDAIRRLAEATDALREAEERLSEARDELRDAASLIASTAATTLLRVQQEESSRTASFERRVSILAGVITGPAVVAGVAGANVDFWPLPSDDGTLARGWLVVLVVLAGGAGLAASATCARDPATSRLIRRPRARPGGSSVAVSSVLFVPESVRQLAFELTRGSLSEQEKRLADLRSRSGTVLAAASIAGSFLATKNGDVDTFAALAIIAYLFCVGAAIYVLLPHALVLEFRGSVITELDEQLGGGLDAAYDAVTEWLEEFHEENRDKLAALGRWFTASCAALGAEVVLWTVSVTGTM